MKRYSAVIFDIFILVALSLTPLLWIGPGQYVTGNDAAYPVNIPDTYKQRFFGWNTADNFGQDTSMHFGSLFIHTVLAAYNAVGLSATDAQRLTFVFWFFVILISMYVFASSQRISKYRYFPLIASVLYGVNFYLLELWKLGAATTFSVYAALPLFLRYILPVFTDNARPVAASVSVALLFLFLNGGLGFSTPLYGGVIITIGIAMVYFPLFQNGYDIVRHFLRAGVMLATFIVLSFVLNAYAVLPFLYYSLTNYTAQLAGHGGADGAISWAREVSKFTSILNLFRLQGFPDWYETGVGPDYAKYYLQHPLLILVSMMFAPLAFLSLLLPAERKNRQLVVFFCIVSLVAVFFSAGTHDPTGWLFMQLMKLVPGFAVFRSAQFKFVPALYFAFAFLGSYAVSTLFLRLEKTSQRVWIKRGVLPIAFVLLLLAYHFPYFETGNFVWKAPLTTLVRIPEYITAYDRWNAARTDDSRTLLLPPLNAVWGAEAYTWGFSSVGSLFGLLSPKPFVSNSYLLNTDQQVLVNRLYDEVRRDGPLLPDLMSMLHVSHVLLRNDSFKDLSWIPSEDPSTYRSILEKASGFSKAWERGKWQVYASSYPKGDKFYLADSLVELVGDAKHVIAPVLLGYGNFYHKQSSAPDDRFRNAGLTSGTIYGLSCSLCSLDSPVSPAGTSGTRILPGSLLYPIKKWKEQRSTGSGVTGDAKFYATLGLTLNRASEIGGMIDLERIGPELFSTIETLRSNWTFILKEYESAEVSRNDAYRIRAVESYALGERNILKRAEGSIHDKRLLERIQGITAMLDTVLLSTQTLRKETFTTKTYAVPAGTDRGDIFLDARTLPTGPDNSPVLPESIQIRDGKTLLRPSINGEKIFLGTYDVKDTDSFTLRFPPALNRIENERVSKRRLNGLTKYCYEGAISGYDWRKRYRLTILSPWLFGRDSYVYVSQANKSIGDGQLSEVQVKEEKAFNVTTDRNTEQYEYFSGVDGDTHARIYYCSDTYAEAEEHIGDFRIDEITEPSVYITGVKQAGADSQTAVDYVMINPTSYRISVPDHSGTILAMNENFNANWKLYELPESETFEPGPFFALTNARVDEDRHFALNGYANAWLLPQGPAKTYLVYFYPQQLFLLGTVVTSIGLIAVVAVGAAVIIKKYAHH